MDETVPQFSALAEIEESTLLARLEAVRKTISHAGEKGRSLENEVSRILRSFLPSEYGLSSGFIAYRSSDGVKLSPQLDIIIYDALRCCPIARLCSCDVFPIEAVYAYIEVKASLQSTSNNRGCPRSKAAEGGAEVIYREPLVTTEVGYHRLSPTGKHL